MRIDFISVCYSGILAGEAGYDKNLHKINIA
jgi:hypothetical protein